MAEVWWCPSAAYFVRCTLVRPHLVNAHEGKAGMVLFAGKTVWSMPECFECTTLAKKALYKYSSFPFLSFYIHAKKQNWSERVIFKWQNQGKLATFIVSLMQFLQTGHGCFFVSRSSAHSEQHTRCPHGRNTMLTPASIHTLHVLASFSLLLSSFISSSVTTQHTQYVN